MQAILPEAAKALPSEFLSAYKSPCWTDATYNATRCLPYFYILGVFQCGTRDLYARVSGHKQVGGRWFSIHIMAQRHNTKLIEGSLR